MAYSCYRAEVCAILKRRIGLLVVVIAASRSAYERNTSLIPLAPLCCNMAEERVEVTLNVPADGALDDLLVTEDTLIVEINEPRNSGENGDSGEATHNLKNLNDTDLERGDYVVDDRGPTPSAEKNTVCITEVTDERIDEHTIDRLGETVYEYNDRSYDPSDRVVKGVYTHLNAEREYSFPASRLRDV